MKIVAVVTGLAGVASAATCTADQITEMAKCTLPTTDDKGEYECAKAQEYVDCNSKAAAGCDVAGVKSCESKDLFTNCKDLTCTESCFPATATVLLADNSTKQMGQLQPGDKVHVGKGQFSEVYFFSTQLESATAKFVSLSTGASDTPLLMTAGHYLYVNGALKTAKTVQVGDMLTLANGNEAKVTAVKEAYAPGLYNPHTLNGDIVVDGILTSTYTDAVDPTLAHALLLPLRQMYALGSSFGKGFSAAAKGVPTWVRQAIRA